MRPNLRDRFMENVRMQRMTSNFKSPLKDIVSYYKGKKIETNLTRTVGLRKIPWSGCFEFPPAYPPGLMHNYREVIASSQVGYPFPTMPMNPNMPSGHYCKGCGAKMVLVKKDQETLTDRKQELSVYHCLEEPAHNMNIKKSFDFKKYHAKKLQKRGNSFVYQAIMEDEEYEPHTEKQQNFKISENYKLTQKGDISNIKYHNPEKCVLRTSTCSNCGTIFDPLIKTRGQELLVYIEQEDAKIDSNQTEDKLASTHTKKKSTIKSFFRTISPKLRRKMSEEIRFEDDKNSKKTKYSDCIVTGGNCLHLLGKSIPFSDPSSDSSLTTPKYKPQGCACETLERYNERKTFEENCTCEAYKGLTTKLSSFSESDELFDQTKDDVCKFEKSKKKKNYMKFFKRKSPDIKNEAKIKVAYECTCESDNIQDKCSCEDIELGCNCGDEETRKKSGKIIKYKKNLKSLCDGGIKETKMFSKRHKKDFKPVKIEICSPTLSVKWKNVEKMLSEADDDCKCGVFDLKTPTRSKSSLLSIVGPATEMDETLSQRRLRKSEFVRTKSILEVTRGKLEPARPISRILDIDNYSKPVRTFKNKETHSKKFIPLNIQNKRWTETEKNRRYITPSYTPETTPEPFQTQYYPTKTIKRKKRNSISSLKSYIQESKPGEYIFHDYDGTGKIPYFKEVFEGNPVFYTINEIENLDSNEEFSTDSLEEITKMCSSKDIDTRDIEFYDEIDSSSSGPPRKRSVHFDESHLFCPLDRNIPKQTYISNQTFIPKQTFEIDKNKLRMKRERQPLWDSSIKKKSKRYEVEMCPHGSSFNIVSKLKSDSTLPLKQRRNKNNHNTSTVKNVQKNFLNNIPKQDCLIYHMSQNVDTNIDKKIEYLTRKQSHPENHEINHDGEKVNLSTAMEALDKLSLENARNPGKDPQVYTCFCKHFPVESESETEESSSFDPVCMKEEKLENIFPDIESNLIKRNDVDVISLIANVLGMKHPLVQPPEMVLKKDKEAPRHKIQEAPVEIETKAIGKINVQRLEKKVEQDIKALDTELEERKALVGTLKERIMQEKERLEAEKNRLDTRNSELGRIDPVTGELLPRESKDEKGDGKTDSTKGN